MVHPLLRSRPRPDRSPRLDPIALVAGFRASGWRYPFREGDGLEVWRGSEHLGTVPFELVLHLVTHYLQGAALQGAVVDALARKPPAPAGPRLPAAGGRRLRRR